MGLMDIIKPLSTVQSSGVQRSQQNEEKREHRESNPGLLSEKQECHFCAMQTPLVSNLEIVYQYHLMQAFRPTLGDSNLA